ncbi:hypothetical protein [Sphingomonas sp. BK235]|uniref:hypothetical protein n=1 Tax=Sphingomonas sp. BK235 TaxID=2512131 RepID=UPI0010DF3459|nr:hypothetical protein [Sphingomonas sp. BK235]TCP37038.1 hypothetical protein EV292_101545 [Sphingomonas sp. BK235]
MSTVSLLLPLLAAALPAAQAPLAPAADAGADPRCAVSRGVLPAGLDGWTRRAPLAAGTSTRSAPVIAVGRGADLRLAPVEQVTPALVPQRVPDEGETAGLALFQVARPGTYRVALGDAAWIDVVRAGHALTASAHGHGPACSGIRKMVDFQLEPGRYVLQLSGTRATSLPVLIARWPRVAA